MPTTKTTTKKKSIRPAKPETGAGDVAGDELHEEALPDDESPSNLHYAWIGKATDIGQARGDFLLVDEEKGASRTELEQDLFELASKVVRGAVLSAQRHGKRLTRVPEVEVHVYESGHTHVVVREGDRVVHERTTLAPGESIGPEDTRTDEERVADADELREFLAARAERFDRVDEVLVDEQTSEKPRESVDQEVLEEDAEPRE